MLLLWRGFARHCRLETWLLMSVLTISVLLFAFGLIAQEVSEGELLTFDKSVMRALRNSANPSSAVRASNGLRRAKARSNGRGCHVGRSRPMLFDFNFTRSPTT